jgi:hypothetical protein
VRQRRRFVLGCLSGFGFGLFLATTLICSGTLPLDTPALTLFPVLGLVFGVALASWAPLRRRTRDEESDEEEQDDEEQPDEEDEAAEDPAPRDRAP